MMNFCMKKDTENIMKENVFPPGWDETRVQRVLAHYDAQTEEDAVAEDQAAFEDASQTVIEIPHELVPLVRELIAKYQQHELVPHTSRL